MGCPWNEACLRLHYNSPVNEPKPTHLTLNLNSVERIKGAAYATLHLTQWPVSRKKNNSIWLSPPFVLFG
jgi:hypothetical protein